jgi:EmrB/QacA subfamily drug resistance transporter
MPPLDAGTPTSRPDRSRPDTGPRSERIVLALACVAQFMVVLDVSVVNVALPAIGRDLHYSATGLQWVVNAYVLTFAGFLLLGGRTADLFGRRRAYLAGMALFSLASLVGGFAQSSAWLTTARAVQGVGGALLSPATLTIVVTTFSGARLARALALWSAMAGAGGAAGSLLGGVLTAQASWRWVLFINVPIGVAAIGFALRHLTELRRSAAGGRLDVAGAVLVTGGLAAVIYAIVGTNTHPWSSGRTVSALAVGGVLLVLFAFVETRIASTPLVPFRLFRSRSLSGANVVMFLIGAAFFAMWYFLSLYLQNVLGFGPLRAGVAFFPMAVAIIVGAQVSGRVINRVGCRPLLLGGTVLAGAGFAWLSKLPPVGDYWLHVFGPSLVIATALGLLFTPLAATATAGVEPAEAGLASGVLNTSRQMGGSLGLAVLATIATDHAHALLSSGRRVDAALASGYGRAFAVAAGLVALAFAVSLTVPNVGRPSPEAARAPAAPVPDTESPAIPSLGTEPA